MGLRVVENMEALSKSTPPLIHMGPVDDSSSPCDSVPETPTAKMTFPHVNHDINEDNFLDKDALVEAQVT